MPTFPLDEKEYDHIDKYATCYQQQYGIPNYNEVEWNGYNVDWKKHQKKLDENIFTKTDTWSTTIPKPKEIHKVTKEDKAKITHNGI
jgi:hypothetical protein